MSEPIKLPDHKFDLHITHNEHRNLYQTLAEFLAYVELGTEAWVSPEERERALATDSLWVLQWYPDTPVGFHRLAASTLEALLEGVKGL